MRYGSVCSGIEAATVAWHGLDWDAAWFSEIEPFPCAVLQHHYPTVPNYGDMLTLPARIAAGEIEAPDVFCGGTPCQAFSIAGLRKSLLDDRGNLTLTFCEIANAIDAARHSSGKESCVVFWENVPGVLNTDDNAFGCFLAALAGESLPLQPPGGRWTNAGAVLGPQRTVAWRVLDAQHFGVAQRRKRIFLVASARKDFDPCEVLFERDGVRRNSATGRTAQQEVAGSIGDSATQSSYARMLGFGHYAIDGKASALKARDYKDATDLIVFDTTQVTSPSNYSSPKPGAPCHPLAATAHPPAIATTSTVRRLTPRECERLQGFPDDYTAIPWNGKSADNCPDGPRYKALGNSWAVPVVRWIGARIDKECK